MEKSHLIISNNNQNLGFSIDSKNKVRLILPKFYQDTSIQNIQEEILTFYQILKKYSKEYAFNKSIKEENNFQEHSRLRQDSDQTSSYFFLNIYFSLLTDFQNNQLLKFDQYSTNKLPRGRMNWTRTSRTDNEIIIHNQVFYKEFFHNNIQVDHTHPITIMHASAISRIAEALDLKITLPYSKLFLSEFEKQHDLIQHYLRVYQVKMFSDRERFIFNHLEQLYGHNNFINYLKHNSEPLMYVERFDMIWEKMLSTCLTSATTKLDINLPKGSYTLNEQVFASGLKMIPDLILKHRFKDQEFILVLDAKNYVPDLEKGSGLPGSADILKQACYKFFLTTQFDPTQKYENRQIINAFLLPYLSKEGEHIKYFGKHRFDAPFNQNNFADILCFGVDFKRLRDNYLNPNIKFRNAILNEISQTYASLESMDWK